MFYLRVMRPKDADWMTNNVDPDQNAPSDLSKNLGSLQHFSFQNVAEVEILL